MIGSRRAYLEVLNSPYAASCRTLQVGDIMTIGRSGRCGWCLPDARALSPQQATICWDGALLHVYSSPGRDLTGSEREVESFVCQPGEQMNLRDLRLAVWADGAAFQLPNEIAPLGKLRAHLASFANPMYIIVDAAAKKGTRAWLDEQPFPYQSLFQGESQRNFSSQAPYLMQADPHHPAIDPILRYLWGRSMMTIIVDTGDFDAVRSHLRQFLIASDPSGRSSYFRYYDPRILAAFLPTCTTDQARRFFGTALCWIAETRRSASVLEYGLDGNILNTNLFSLA